MSRTPLWNVNNFSCFRWGGRYFPTLTVTLTKGGLEKLASYVIGLLQLTITWYKIRDAGGQARLIIIPALGHQNKGKSSFTGSGLFVLMSQCGNNNELALQHGGFCITWSLVGKGPFDLRCSTSFPGIFFFIPKGWGDERPWERGCLINLLDINFSCRRGARSFIRN